jgi:hypothetical protein
LDRAEPIAPKLVAKTLATLAAGVGVLALAGCGGIEFEGKLFDYAGLSGSGQKQDPRMTERAPLIIPPDTNRLPPPGAPAIARGDWPLDSDVARKQAVAAKETEEKQREIKNDPTNPYAGKETLLDKMFSKKDDEEEEVAVPEPDAADKTPQDRARAQAAASPQKAIDHSLNAPTVAPENDPFHPQTPKSYDGMSNPSGNNANF